jgi:hypothetical protein
MIDAKSMAIISTRQIRYGTREGDTPWFNDGFLLNDHPRLTELTDRIIKATVGFAVARTDTGAIMAEYPDLKSAQAAVDGATIKLSFNVDIAMEEEDAPSAADVDFTIQPKRVRVKAEA